MTNVYSVSVFSSEHHGVSSVWAGTISDRSASDSDAAGASRAFGAGGSQETRLCAARQESAHHDAQGRNFVFALSHHHGEQVETRKIAVNFLLSFFERNKTKQILRSVWFGHWASSLRGEEGNEEFTMTC